MQGGWGVIVLTSYAGHWTQTALGSDIHASIVYGINIFAFTLCVLVWQLIVLVIYQLMYYG